MFKKLLFVTFVLLGVLAFWPATPDVMARVPVQATASCDNLILNGDMETADGWQLNSGQLAGRYVTDVTFSGERSLLVGATPGQPVTRQVVSSAWQAIRIPPTESSTLSFWYRPETDLNPGADRQYIGFIGTDGSVIKLFVNTLANQPAWQYFTADVSNYAGRTLWLYFGVDNDGWGGGSRIYVDDVTLCSEGVAATDANATLPDTPTVPTTVDLPTGADIVTWEQFGFDQPLIKGPYGGRSYRFGLPSDWSVQSGAEIQLDVQLFNPLATAVNGQNDVPVGTLQVRYNGQPLTPIFLSGSGEQTLTIPLPDNSLRSIRTDGRHELQLSLNSDLACDAQSNISLLVLPTSRFIYPHTVQSVVADLRLLPRPFFQDSFEEESAVIIVPAEPTSADMTAALAVAGGFGQMTEGDLLLSVLTADALTAETQAASHLVFVGQPDAFSMLDEVALPEPVVDGRFQIARAQPEDGIVQIAVSPWNSRKAVMIISGGSDTAVAKAGQAVSSGVMRVGVNPGVAVVKDLFIEAQPQELDELDETLATLGYKAEELNNRGANFAEYRFSIPSGHVVGADAFLDLDFTSSALLNYEQSGVVVSINGQQLGSARLDETSTSSTRVRFNVPRYVVRSGVNELLVRAELEPLSDCLDPNFDGLWLTISPDSHIQLPLTQLEQTGRGTFDLGDYPDPFTYDLTLENTAFVLPMADPTSWSTAVQLAYDLGDRLDSPYSALQAVFVDDIPEETLNSKHLVVFGRPSQLPILSDMAEVMPAPFVDGSDLADESNLRVRFRLPGDSSAGYLEMFPSPWNQNRAVLTILGSSNESVGWAGTVLVTPTLRGQLEGNLAVIDGQQVVVGVQASTEQSQAFTVTTLQDNEPGTETAVVTDASEETAVEPVTITSGNTAANPAWILPTVGVATALMGLVLLALFFNAWRERRLS